MFPLSSNIFLYSVKQADVPLSSNILLSVFFFTQDYWDEAHVPCFGILLSCCLFWRCFSFSHWYEAHVPCSGYSCFLFSRKTIEMANRAIYPHTSLPRIVIRYINYLKTSAIPPPNSNRRGTILSQKWQLWIGLCHHS